MAKVHENDTEQQILAAAYDLFFTLGYKQTTIRKIIQKAGVRNGSLYHFYTSKDDIFSHLVKELLSICRQRAEDLTGPHADPLLTYCTDTALKFQIMITHPTICELFGDAFSSWDSMKEVLDSAVTQDIQLFSHINRDLTLEQCYMREVIIYGSLRGLTQAGYFQHIPYQTLIEYHLPTALHLFNVPEPTIKELGAHATQLVEDSANYDIFDYARKKLQGSY